MAGNSPARARLSEATNRTFIHQDHAIEQLSSPQHFIRPETQRGVADETSIALHQSSEIG